MEIDLKCDLCEKITLRVELGKVFYLPSNPVESVLVEDSVICPKCKQDISNQQFLLKKHELLLHLFGTAMVGQIMKTLPKHLQGVYTVHEKDYSILQNICKSKPKLVNRFYNNKPRKGNTSQTI